MQRRYDLVYFVFALGLTMLMVSVDAQAKIAFVSDRDGHSWEIYVMDDDGQNLQNLTNMMFGHASAPAWFRPTFAVASIGKTPMRWGWLKGHVR